MKHKITALAICILFSYTLFASKYNKREMRAVWVSTLLNLDWPSKSGLSSEEQKSEFIKLLDIFEKNKINTVIIQVRPSGDAIYPSKYAVWSKWLTGTQNIAPDNNFDPLKFIVEECHKRCMEVHAWFNPFRSVYNTEKNPACSSHISNTHPEWIIKYGNNKFLDPGNPKVREYVKDIVCEVVENYDIDAIHFDDYFYPHESKNAFFEDYNSFDKYGGTFYDIKDWRRDNVNKFIELISKSIHTKKSHIKFGISPFPVWRSKTQDPELGVDIKSSSSYDDLCADVLLWVNKGWIDYIMPQLYGNIGNNVLNYTTLIKWWNANCNKANLYIGQAIYKLDANSKNKEWQSSQEIINQLNLNNTYESVKGHSFFRAQYFKTNPLNITEKLNQLNHRYPALLPINKNIPAIIPKKLDFVFLENKNNTHSLTWDNTNADNKYFIIYKYKGLFPHYSAQNIYKITTKKKVIISEKDLKAGYKFCVSSISKTHHESKPTKAFILNS